MLFSDPHCDLRAACFRGVAYHALDETPVVDAAVARLPELDPADEQKVMAVIDGTRVLP